MPWAWNFCPFRAYWIISSVQVNIVLVVFFTCPNVVMDIEWTKDKLFLAL